VIVDNMAGIESAIAFLAMVGFISLSGVIMPGPVFAATVAKGYNDSRAGLKIALGHAAVEIPLIIAIFLGLDYVFQDQAIFATIGIMGGTLLVYMGYSMIRTRKDIIVKEEESRYGAFVAGVLTTVTNPYFFIWWATVGAALIATALEFGLIILPFFALVHIACDLFWEHLVSFSVFKTKGMWSPERHHLLFMLAGAIMLVFGVYFVSSSVIGLA
jgi:threonine/homoserine/homoserine lactone efflux protein